MLPASALDRLATLLEYPREGYAALAREARASLEALLPAAAGAAEPFWAFAASAQGHDAEELYARTFDWSPERALEIGWHLYGEQYDRGAFLVRMRERLRVHGVEEGGDLPDHLASVLRLLPRMEAAEAADLVGRHVRPALRRLEQGFSSVPDNPYGALIRAVAAALAERQGGDR